MYCIKIWCPDETVNVDFREAFPLIISFTVVFAAIMLGIKLYLGKKYVFTEKVISVYDRKNYIDAISVDEIESMHYYKFRLWYIIYVLFGEIGILNGFWVLHLRMKNGTIKNIGYLSVKDVKRLKDKLYHDLITIHKKLNDQALPANTQKTE